MCRGGAGGAENAGETGFSAGRVIEHAMGETEVSVVRFMPGDTRIYQKASFIGTVLEDAGLSRPPSQDVEDFAIRNASAEITPPPLYA